MTDNSIISALFQIMKFNILSASRAENQRSPFSDDYFFAWSSGVYPYGSEIDFHKPFGSEFQVSQSQMEDLAELLDCLLYTSPSPRDLSTPRMPSSA